MKMTLNDLAYALVGAFAMTSFNVYAEPNPQQCAQEVFRDHANRSPYSAYSAEVRFRLVSTLPLSVEEITRWMEYESGAFDESQTKRTQLDRNLLMISLRNNKGVLAHCESTGACTSTGVTDIKNTISTFECWLSASNKDSDQTSNLVADRPSGNVEQNSNAKGSGNMAGRSRTSATSNNSTSQMSVGNQREAETSSQGQPSGESANQCISLQEGKYNEVKLHNDCAQAIQVKYCVDNPRSLFKCGKIGGGMLELKPGRSYTIVDHKKRGGGEVLFASCLSPQTPRGWRYVNGSGYDCR